MPARNFFQLLRIDGYRDANVLVPESVAVVPVVTTRKRAAGALFVPSDCRNPCLVLAGGCPRRIRKQKRGHGEGHQQARREQLTWRVAPVPGHSSVRRS